MDKSRDTVDWLDLDEWLEKDSRQHDMQHAFTWLNQDCHLGEQQLHNSQLHQQALPEPLHHHAGLLFQDNFQQPPGPLLQELTGVSQESHNAGG